jgi:hypothetical protein
MNRESSQSSQSTEEIIYLPLIISDLMYKSKICNELGMKLSNLNYYTKVMIVAQELFTQKDFKLKFDLQPELLGFNNGNYHLNLNRLRVPLESERVFMSVGYNYRSDKMNFRDEIISFWERLGLLDMLPIVAKLLHGNVRNPIVWVNGLNDRTCAEITKLLSWTLGDYMGTLAFSELRKRKIPHIQNHTHVELVNNCCKRLIVVEQEETDFPAVYQPMMDTLLNKELLNLRKPYEVSNDYYPQFGIIILSKKTDSEPSPDAMVFKIKENLPPNPREQSNGESTVSESPPEASSLLNKSNIEILKESYRNSSNDEQNSNNHSNNDSKDNDNSHNGKDNDDSRNNDDNDNDDDNRSYKNYKNKARTKRSKDIIVKDEWKYEFIRILFEYLNK